MTYVVTTQFLENYGAHTEDGRFSSGNAYWKFKGGSDYVVDGLDREQDAVAFVAALCIQNNLACKEFPVKWQTYEEWVDSLPEDKDYREFLIESAICVDANKIEGLAA
jgi:hypothetical protein